MSVNEAWAKKPVFWVAVGGVIAVFVVLGIVGSHKSTGTSSIIQQAEEAPPAVPATASASHAHSTRPEHHASKAMTTARRWVAQHGGVLDVPRTGWVANQSTWTGTWPWGHYDYAEVVCTSAYGGVSYVMLGSEGYMFDSANGVPQGNPLNVNGNALVEAENGSTAQVDAAYAWQAYADNLCPAATRND